MGRFVIVTGSSQGLGAALASEASEQAKTLVSIARHDNPQLHEQARKNQCELIFEAVDLTQAELIDQLALKLTQLIEDSDCDEFILINNAGMLGPMAQFDGLTEIKTQALIDTFNLNIAQIIKLTSHVLQATKGKGKLKVLNISSGAARSPYPGWAAYCASKAALDMYSQIIQTEAPHAKVVSLAPGVLDTSMQKMIRQSKEKDFPNLERFQQLHKNQQLSNPQQVAKKIYNYLQSESFGTSHTIQDLRDF